MRTKTLLIILLITAIPGLSIAQSDIAQTQEFFVDFTTSTKTMAIEWPSGDPMPSYNPFDSLANIKSNTNDFINQLQSAYEVEQYKTSIQVVQTLERLEIRIKMIELSIQAIEERLQLLDLKN